MNNMKKFALLFAVAVVCSLAFAPMAFAFEPFDSMDPDTKKTLGLFLGIGVIFLSAWGLQVSHKKFGKGPKQTKKKKKIQYANTKKKGK